MTYTCSDFSMDIARCLIDAAVVEADAYADADIGAQADLAIAGIIDAGRSARAARFVSLVLKSSLATDTGTLADSLRLADAIAKDATLVLAPTRASFAAFIATLPGGADWSRYLTVHRG
ncbi:MULTISPECIES: hypothetical protein [unclassified Paraburkholderia]|uniref:hypothetical protein n=1 Tax=unclassified Paraburkholderia TaxID=2615204 RepID=UPI002AAF22FF|nr:MULTISPECIES: hypothetical protein [unclassified Paraburkholderia]